MISYKKWPKTPQLKSCPNDQNYQITPTKTNYQLNLVFHSNLLKLSNDFNNQPNIQQLSKMTKNTNGPPESFLDIEKFKNILSI